MFSRRLDFSQIQRNKINKNMHIACVYPYKILNVLIMIDIKTAANILQCFMNGSK